MTKPNDERQFFRDFNYGFYDLHNPALWKLQKDTEVLRNKVRKAIGAQYEQIEGSISLIGDPEEQIKKGTLLTADLLGTAPIIPPPAPLIAPAPAPVVAPAPAPVAPAPVVPVVPVAPVPVVPGVPLPDLEDDLKANLKDFDDEIAIIDQNILQAINKGDKDLENKLTIDKLKKEIEKLEHEIDYRTQAGMKFDEPRLERKIKKAREAITKLQTANPTTKLQERLNNLYSKIASPSFITMKIRKNNFVLDDWIISVSEGPNGEQDLVYTNGKQTLKRPEPSEGYLRLLTINDANAIENDKTILKNDVLDFKKDLMAMGLTENPNWTKDEKKRLTQEKYKLIMASTFEGYGMRRNFAIKYYSDPQELINRLEVVMGSISVGNTSLATKNEGAEILRTLLFKQVITKAEHNALMAKL